MTELSLLTSSHRSIVMFEGCHSHLNAMPYSLVDATNVSEDHAASFWLYKIYVSGSAGMLEQCLMASYTEYRDIHDLVPGTSL